MVKLTFVLFKVVKTEKENSQQGANFEAEEFDPEPSGTVEQDWYEIQIWIGSIPICDSEKQLGFRNCW